MAIDLTYTPHIHSRVQWILFNQTDNLKKEKKQIPLLKKNKTKMFKLRNVILLLFFLLIHSFVFYFSLYIFCNRNNQSIPHVEYLLTLPRAYKIYEFFTIFTYPYIYIYIYDTRVPSWYAPNCIDLKCIYVLSYLYQ